MADKLRIPKLKQSNHSESSDGSPDAMYRMTPSDRGRRISGMFADLFRTANSSLSPADPDGLRYLAVVSVIGHWFIAAVVLFEIVYRPYYGLSRYAAYILLLLILVGFTGDLHHRLRSGRTITSLRLQALYAMDLALVSASLAISYGFRHPFIHLFYYPALATFALVSTSLGRTMAVVTTVSIIYIATSLTVGDGLDFVARDEKALVARIVLFYVVVLTVDVASRFERIRWQNAVARERQLQQERIELSQTLHDTTAQTVYMIGLGIHRDSTTGPSGSLRDLQPTPDLPGLEVSHFCWLPTHWSESRLEEHTKPVQLARGSPQLLPERDEPCIVICMIQILPIDAALVDCDVAVDTLFELAVDVTCRVGNQEQEQGIREDTSLCCGKLPVALVFPYYVHGLVQVQLCAGGRVIRPIGNHHRHIRHEKAFTGVIEVDQSYQPVVIEQHVLAACIVVHYTGRQGRQMWRDALLKGTHRALGLFDKVPESRFMSRDTTPGSQADQFPNHAPLFRSRPVAWERHRESGGQRM